MPGRCGSSRWTPETTLRKRLAAGLPCVRGYTPWAVRSITPWLIRSVGCTADQGGPRPPACALWHETESALPISLDERALS